MKGSLALRPGSEMTSLTSPSWKTIAYWRWSTVNSDIEAITTSSSSVPPIRDILSRINALPAHD